MYIYPKSVGPVGPDATRSTPSTSAPDQKPVGGVSPAASATDRGDRVEISDAGRTLAARDGAGSTSSAGLDPARAASIRDRVLNGAYDTLEVVDAVSRRLLDSGDL